MCYDPKDRPPDPPGATGAATGRDLELTAEDGNRFMAFLAEPAHAGRSQVLILPDVRGLHDFYRALALRFAETSVRALAIDYFGRTAGIGPRDDAFEHMSHVKQVRLETILMDIRAGLAHLRQGDRALAPAFVAGFCFGGSVTLVSATEAFDLAGVIPFYGGLSRELGGRGTVLQQAKGVHYPMLGLYGGADQGIPPEQIEQLNRALEEGGVEHQIVVYPGAPHSFFDRKQVEFAEQSADAWRRALAFIDAHS